METAGEIVQGVFQGHWGKVQQGAIFTEHKLHEIPLEEECSVSSGRQAIRHQCKLTENISQDRMHSCSPGQQGSRQSQVQRGGSLAQHKFHYLPFRDCSVTSGQQATKNQCNPTESSSQQGDKQSSSHMKQLENQKPQEASTLKFHENPCRNPQSCSSGRSNPKGNKSQDISCGSHGSDSENPYAGLVDSLRATFMSGKTRPCQFRVTQLEALCHFLEERQADIQHALCEDLHKPCFESEITEIIIVRNELANALNNINCWMKDENVNKNLVTQLDSAFIRKEPYGVVLIIGAFNYPIQLTLLPLVGAIAAGNCVILKPSELSSCTERLLAEALPCYLDPQVFAVVTAGPEETGKLLENKFDYIFYTGNVRVGKIIMTAAAKHATPLTLELGGKSPCYVDKCCNFQNAANRIVWGKFLNAGQTCIAPDYVICTLETQERLMPCLRQAICEFFGNDPKQSADFGRMVNDKHFQRARALLECGRVAIGGETCECERYIAPTVLADVKESDPIMQEEVFGPILPIFTVKDIEEAIHFINCRDRPLAVYAFSCDSKIVNQILDHTSSGGFCGNDTVLQASLVTLPFGGIGCSGFGKYHGKFTFDTFTHFRGCLSRYIGLEAINRIRYPPYNDSNLRMAVASMEIRRKGMCTLL